MLTSSSKDTCFYNFGTISYPYISAHAAPGSDEPPHFLPDDEDQCGNFPSSNNNTSYYDKYCAPSQKNMPIFYEKY